MASPDNFLDQFKTPLGVIGFVCIALIVILVWFVANSSMSGSQQFVAFVIMVGFAISAIWAMVSVAKKEDETKAGDE